MSVDNKFDKSTIRSFTKVVDTNFKNRFYLEARPEGKLAAALILSKILIPTNFSYLFPQDRYCWQGRVDVNDGYRKQGLATGLLELGDQELIKYGFGGDLRMFVDKGGKGFNQYLLTKKILAESAKTTFFRI